MKKNYILAIFCTVLLASCVEEFWPEFESTDKNSLVVEGYLSNDVGPYQVMLSRSRSIDSIPQSTSREHDTYPVKNAIVNIIDDQGNVEALVEISDGVYETNNPSFQGIIGRSYKISIDIGGTLYESEFEPILETIEIESVNTDETEIAGDISGYRFNVSTEAIPDEQSFFMWKLIETYEYHTAYTYSHYFDGTFANRTFNMFGQLNTKGNASVLPPHNLLEKDYPEELETCWLTKEITNIYINSNEFKFSDRLENFPLNFIPFNHESIREKYSLLVKQHRISREAYNFLKIVNDQNSFDELDLYTKQPFQIRGNVNNINDPDEAVLGFFIVSGVTEKRAFAPSDPHRVSDKIYSVDNCRLLTVRWDEYGNPVNFTLDRIIELTPDWMWPDDPELFPWLPHPLHFSWVWIKNPRNNPITYEIGFSAIARTCWDCREKGGVTEKPSYWED